MDTNYKLINSIDPSKCRTKIRDKFAKLTLSSNKKKQEDAAMQQQIRENATLSNISRNLMNELLTDDESEDEKPAEKQPTENLLMRTDSSPSDDNVATRKSSLQSMNTTHCTEAEESGIMERLHVSETDNTQADQNLENAIETLSSRVSMLTVEGPLTISSEGSGPSLTQIVSTENQRMDTGHREPEATLTPKARDAIDDSICISSETEESVITISDSSKSGEEIDVNMTPSYSSVSHRVLDAVKEERMAKFLLDVKRNYGLPVTPERDFEDRSRQIATADTEPMSSETLSQSIGAARRVAAADTESMSACGEFTAAEREEAVQSTSIGKLAAADTEDMTKASETMMSSPRYEPVMKIGTEFLNDSATDARDSLPEDSLTIAETSEEEEESEKEEQHMSQQALRESKSPSVASKRTSSSSEQDSQIQINISAKINIKIQFSQQDLQESSSSHNTTPSPTTNRSARESLEDSLHSSAQKAHPQPSALQDIPHSPPERDVPVVSPKTDVKSPDDFERAERLLNELYGSSWKTPEVLHSLKKTTMKRVLPNTSTKNPPLQPNPTDESSVGDFSIFRKNIPQHLDSTRLAESPSTFKTPQAIRRAPRSVRRVVTNREDETPKTSGTQIVTTKSGRKVQQRLASIVDSDTDSEGENASVGSNQSWKKSDEENIENKAVAKPQRTRRKNNISRSPNDDDLVYMDLSKDEVEIQHDISTSPPANNDANFNRRLEEILMSCKPKEKPKIEFTPGGRPKRKLFTAQINDNDEIAPPPFDSPKERLQNLIGDDASVSLSGGPLPSMFEPFNKHLEAVKLGKPIFKVQTPKSKRDTPKTDSPDPSTPKTALKQSRVVGDICLTPKDTYGFLKSLDLCVGKSFCHPDALYYRDNYRLKKDELAGKLYEIYNRKCFNGELDVPLKWNKKLTNTAGRCMNKKRLGERTSVIELSEKVLTSADRLRCTLIHELCHAATWIFNGEGGHGASWKAWARKANQIFPELPKIGVCHQYDIEYKYTYKCTLCAAKSHAHSKSKKVENIRCSYCHGAIEVYLNKKDKEGNVVATPVKEPAGFAKFVKEKYKTYKTPDLKHADVMKLLSSEFASMKVDAGA